MLKKIKEILKRIRMFFLLNFKYKFIKTGKNFYCGRNLFVRPNTVTVGDNVFINNNAHLAVSELYISDFTMLGPNVSIVGGDHKFDVVGVPSRNTGRDIEKPVKIGKDAWLGAGSTIVHGVKIGEGSVIAAGSLVLKDVPPYTIYGGHPAKFIKNRFSNKEDIIKHSKAIQGIYA